MKKKSAKPSSGSNLKMGKASQSQHVMPKKDNMAANVSNHMGQGDQMGKKQPVMQSKGGSAPKKIMSKY